MGRLVLLTGGAGFIGSHIAELLLARGDRVRALDCLLPQVHEDGLRPSYLADGVELVRDDVRDPSAMRAALEGVDAVVHLAAAVGVGQSMYAIRHYTSVNDIGTAVLLEALDERRVERVVVASSMSIYGEGLAIRPDGSAALPARSSAGTRKDCDWQMRDADGVVLTPVATPEEKAADPRSIYALNKYTQEQMTLLACAGKRISAVALRLFNVFGPNQALSNPYTGVLAIFAARLLNGRPPLIFEDGQQRRDFVHVRDVGRAFLLALDRPEVDGIAINVGSGVSRTICSVANDLAAAMNQNDIAPVVTGKTRSGDIRHCFADITRARALLGYAPEADFSAALAEFASSLAEAVAVDRVAEASAELEARGLVG